MNIAVVDARANLVAFTRMDDNDHSVAQSGTHAL